MLVEVHALVLSVTSFTSSDGLSAAWAPLPDAGLADTRGALARTDWHHGQHSGPSDPQRLPHRAETCAPSNLWFAKSPSGFRIRQIKDFATYVRWRLSSGLMTGCNIVSWPEPTDFGSPASEYRAERQDFGPGWIIGEPHDSAGGLAPIPRLLQSQPRHRSNGRGAGYSF
jgi:hypothetical protein